jgi:glycosyltransferase involved in cell wall biosynthesis
VSNILWLSNSAHSRSGYGTQTRVVVPRLRDLGHQVTVAAYHGVQGSPLTIEGIEHLPGSTEDLWAQDVLPGYYQYVKADFLITFMDAWVLQPHLLRGMKVAHWMPVDCEASPAGISPHLSALDRRVLEEGGGQPVAMSQFGRDVLTKAGLSPLYVPHGIETQVFRPLEDRDELRERLGLAGKFVIGINAANQDPVRKALPEQMTAFAQFHKAHPDSVLGIHSRKITRQGIDLERLAADLGLRDCVIFADQLVYCAGLMGDADLAKWYGVLDLLSNASYGEGFGLPIIEAQACGTPVVTTAWSSMPELTGAGWCVAGDPYWNRGHSGWWLRPSVAAIAAAYESAFGEAAGMRDAAREFAVRYDAGTVTREHWVPVLRELEEL